MPLDSKNLKLTHRRKWYDFAKHFCRARHAVPLRKIFSRRRANKLRRQFATMLRVRNHF
jgi:hypothetical protein